VDALEPHARWHEQFRFALCALIAISNESDRKVRIARRETYMGKRSPNPEPNDLMVALVVDLDAQNQNALIECGYVVLAEPQALATTVSDIVEGIRLLIEEIPEP
jgi:hypothetical protein